MPEYFYGCQDKMHPRQVVIHGMLESVKVFCPVCGLPLHRVFTMPTVNWNGLRPSQGELSNVMREHIESRPARMDRYLEKQERSSSNAN